MEQFNKVISFVLGLVVVVLFLAVATGKINLKGTTLPFAKNNTVKGTPTPSTTQKKTTTTFTQVPKTITSSTASNPDYQQYKPGSINTIPNTGPEFLLPLVASSFFGGLFLRGKAKK